MIIFYISLMHIIHGLDLWPADVFEQVFVVFTFALLRFQDRMLNILLSLFQFETCTIWNADHGFKTQVWNLVFSVKPPSSLI